jgi:RHS repeat-associated protein
LGTGDLSGGCQLITTNQYTYDPLGNILTHKDANQNPTTLGYSDSYTTSVTGPTYAYPTTITNALSQKTLITYEYASGTAASVTDPNNAVTNYSHNDPFYRFTGMTAADGGQTSVAYTPTTTTTNRDQTSPGDGAIVTSTIYDGLGRTSETRTFESGGYISVQKTYDAKGRLATVTNPSRSGDGLGFLTSYSYDVINRTMQVTDQDQSATTTSYSGNQTTVTDQASHSRTTTTDALGRLTQVIEDPGSSPHLNYLTIYTYNSLDDLLSVNQGTGSTARNRSFTYDSFKRLTQANNPESGVINYTYDPVGNLLSKIDARFETCYGTLSGTSCNSANAYDGLNRPTIKSYSDPNTSTVSWSYDNPASGAFGIGRLSPVSNGASTTTFSPYDPVGRIKSSSQTLQGTSQPYPFSYTYNLAGSLTTETYPSGRVITTGYDLANRASYVQGTSAGSTANYAGSSSSPIQYSPHGAAWNYKRGNGLTHVEDFNARLQQVQSYESFGNVNTAQNMLLLLCPQWGTGGPTNQTGTQICPASAQGSNNGNLLGYLEFIGGPGNPASPFVAGSPTFQLGSLSYDNINRLTGASDSGGWSRNFVYDQWGNMAVSGASGTAPLNVNTPQANSSTISSLYNSNNQLTMSGIGYDAAGNTNALNTFSGISYDAENRLTAETSNGTHTYQYDGNGRRVTKAAASGNTTTYVYDASGELAAEYDITPQSAQCTTCYLSNDHLGSVRLVTDSSGQVISRHDYLPFGEEIGGGYAGRTPGLGFGTAEGVTQRFTGKERDSESGLDYFGARYYGSALGRFTSPDWSDKPEPVAYANLNDPQTLNLYGYVRNNPLAHSDPDGHCTVDGEQHFGWCIWHTLGFYETQVDRVNDARNFFTNNQVTMNGQTVDPTKLSDKDVLQAFSTFNQQVRDLANMGANPYAVMATAPTVFRGGSSLQARPGVDVKVDSSGMVQPGRGLSVNADPAGLEKFGGARQVESIPPELEIVQRGQNANHYEIAPRQPMTLQRFQELLNQVKLK